MNIEIANRLVELRKKQGLSQEDLADKLGISRQAVSKWERAEASPDTDNLICLAKLYGVSLDELLDTDTPLEDIAREKKEEQEEKAKEEEKKADESFIHINSKGGKEEVHISGLNIHVKDEDGSEVHIGPAGIHVSNSDEDGSDVHIGPGGIHVTSGDDDKLHVQVRFIDKVCGIVFGALMLVAVTAYLLCGFLLDKQVGQCEHFGWAVMWVVFLIPFIVTSFIRAIYFKKFHKVNVAFMCVGIFVSLGLTLGIWHPLWVIFFAIPIYASIAGGIDHLIHKDDVKVTHGDFIDNEEDNDVLHQKYLK